MAGLDSQYIDAIKATEGYTPQATWDYKQYSSGYGTKAQPGDETIPQDQLKQVYEQRFQDEIAKAAAHVDSFAPNLPPGVRAALTSLTFNAGPGWSQSGLGEAVKSGDWDKAREIFLQYNKAGGKVDNGLVARRGREAAWFDQGLPAPTGNIAQAPAAGPPQQAGGLMPAANVGGLGAPQAPMGLMQAPTFPAPQAQQQAAQPQQAGDIFSQMPANQIQHAQIQYAKPRQVDLTRLRAALAQPPIFSRG